jgi:hypothetical protein
VELSSPQLDAEQSRIPARQLVQNRCKMFADRSLNLS